MQHSSTDWYNSLINMHKYMLLKSDTSNLKINLVYKKQTVACFLHKRNKYQDLNLYSKVFSVFLESEECYLKRCKLSPFVKQDKGNNSLQLSLKNNILLSPLPNFLKGDNFLIFLIRFDITQLIQSFNNALYLH